MKKFIYVVCGIAFFAVCTVIGVILYLVTKQEVTQNRSRTEAARNARWKKEPMNLEGKSQEEIDRELDKLNEQKNDSDNGKES